MASLKIYGIPSCEQKPFLMLCQAAKFPDGASDFSAPIFGIWYREAP